MSSQGLDTLFEVPEEVEGLEALTCPVTANYWLLLAKPAQQEMAVARTRAVKDKGSSLSPASVRAR